MLPDFFYTPVKLFVLGSRNPTHGISNAVQAILNAA